MKETIDPISTGEKHQAVERAKAEEALRISEEKYRALFDSIDEGFSILEVLFDDSGKAVDYTFLEMNSAHEAMTGLSQAAIGMRVNELISDLEADVFERLGKVVLTGEPVRYEQYVSEWNRWFDVFSSRVGGNGSLKVANLFTNITKRKQAEAKIKESESRFRTMADASPFLIWTIGADGLSSYYNKTFLDFIGVAKDEDISDWGKIVHPDDVEFTLNTINTAIAERRSYSLECRMLRADRQWRWVLAQGNPSLNTDNEFLGFVGSSVDITERRESETKIKESEQRFQNLVRNATVGIVVLTGESMKVEIVNEAYGRLINLKPEDLLGKPLFSLIPDEEEYYRPLIEKVRQSGNPLHLYDSPYTVKVNGNRIEGFVHIVYQPYRDKQGKTQGVMGIHQDVTEAVKSRKKVEESEKKFQAAISAVEGIIWTNNANGEMVGEQPGWAKLTGQSVEEYQGYNWSSAVHPDDAQPTVDAWNKAVKNQSIFEFEHRLNTKQNGWRLFSVKAVPAIDENGIIKQWVGVHTDITEQREAAKKIKDSESYFRRLTDTVPAIIWITEPNGTCSYLNKLWYDYTGQTEEEAKGSGWLEATHPDDKELVAEIFIKANSEQKPFSLTYRLRNSRGEYRWAVNSGSPKFDAEDIFEGMIGTVVDVHEEKLAEEKLTYRTALLEAHSQASVDGILLVDAKGKIISFNQRFVEIWNMPQHIVDAKDDEAALSFAMTQLVSPHLFIDKVKYLYEHPTETSLDELDFKDGKIVERNGYPVIGEDGSYYAWSWTFKDITKQKHYEKTIIESEQRFRTLAETLPQLIWMTNEKGIYEYASNHWINYSGLDPYLEDRWEKLIHSHDLESLKQGWESSLQTGQTFYSEARLKNKAGAYRWHLVQGEPIKNEKGSIIKWLGAFTDIENLKEEQKQKNDFLSMASHELKTPVTTIKAYGQIIERLLEEKEDLQTLGLVKRMSKQVNRLTILIKDLLDVTKMQKGGLVRYESVFNFNDLVKEVIDDMQKTIATHQILGNLNADLKIQGDKDKLGQVLDNLISNATKYSPGAEKIIVSTQIVKDGVQLSVQDFGIGISTKGQQRVFEQFYRVTGENQSTFQGMGIGLYICAEIIKKEGGKIWVESVAGKGSVFYVWLPLSHTI